MPDEKLRGAILGIIMCNSVFLSCCHFDSWVGVVSLILREFHLHKAVTSVEWTEFLFLHCAGMDHQCN